MGVGNQIIVESDNGVDWHVLGTAAVQLRKSIFAKDQFLAVGEKGTINTSVDGFNWRGGSLLPDDLNSVAFGKNRIVVVGQSQTTLYSNDGQIWNGMESGGPDLYDVVFGNGMFVAVGAGGWVQSSADGVNWEARSNAGVEDLYGITFAKSTFVIVGSSGFIYTSPNANVWSVAGRFETDLFSVYFDGQEFIAFGDSGFLLSSPDGFAWTMRSSKTSNALFGAVAVDGQITLVGDNGTVWSSRPAVPSPRLKISRAENGQLEISWSAAVQFQFQTRKSLADVWTNAAIAVQRTGNDWSVSMPTLNLVEFYRVYLP